MDGQRAAYARLKRRSSAQYLAARSQLTAVIVSGLVGLTGALIGGGVTYAATGRQVHSQERQAAAERLQRDALDRISRRDDIYSAFYASVVDFRTAYTSYDVAASVPTTKGSGAVTSTGKEFDAYFELQRRRGVVAGKYTSVQLVGSARVLSAGDATIKQMTDMSHASDLFQLDRLVDDPTAAMVSLDQRMTALLNAIRDDLNVGDVPLDLEDLIKSLRGRGRG